MPDDSQTMHRFPLTTRGLALFALLSCGTLLLSCNRSGESGGGGSGGGSPLTVTDPTLYRDMVSDFYTGTIALIVDDQDHKERYLKRAIELVPEEPAAWANLGLLYL